MRVSRLFTGAAASTRSSAAAADCRPLAVACDRVVRFWLGSGAAVCSALPGAGAAVVSSGAGSGVASGRVRVTNARSESGDSTTVPVPTWPCVTVAGCCGSSVGSEAARVGRRGCGAACGLVGCDPSGSAKEAAVVPESASLDTDIAADGSKAAGTGGGVARLAVFVSSDGAEGAAAASEGCGAGVESVRLSGCSLKAITATVASSVR